jgi:hypothetical protein
VPVTRNYVDVFLLESLTRYSNFIISVPVIGEKLKHKELQGYGNKTIIDGKEQTIGAGGRYGGVHLAMSDSGTQQRNMAMLKAMFERERQRRNKDKKMNEESNEEV